jgi:hypothetical protein
MPFDRASPAALALALALAAPAASAAPSPQDEGASPSPAAEAAAAEPAPVAAENDLKGRRARAILRRGAVVEGVLPGGIAWERRSEEGGGFEPAREGDSGAGLRFFFVMGMDGEIFISRADVKEVVDLGTLSDELAEEMKVRILQERRDALDRRRRELEAREAQLQRELERLLGPPREDAAAVPAQAPSPDASGVTPGAGSEPAPEPEPEGPAQAEAPAPGTVVTPPAAGAADAPKEETPEQRRRRGDALLERFPPPAWSEERYDVIDTRTRLAKIPPDEEEAAFLAGFDAWKEAFERREAAEAAGKAGAPASSAGGN